LSDFRIKNVLEALYDELQAQQHDMPHALKEDFAAYWPAFSQQIRATRNEAGHPMSIEPITADIVHASLLVFPGLAKISTKLLEWVQTHYKKPLLAR
jgi:hypothetical protein